MKNYENFIKESEDLEQVKSDIAEGIAKETTSDDSLEKQETGENPNEDINSTVKEMIEQLETKKAKIKLDIDLITKQLLDIKSTNSKDPDVVEKSKEMETKLKELQEELKNFDDMVKTSQEQSSSLEEK